MTSLVLIRHGETFWTHQRRFQGSTDTSLTPRGKKQARAIARVVKPLKIDVLYTSYLKRSVQSGLPIQKATGKRIRKDKRINELSFGAWEGKTADELRKSKDSIYLRWIRGKIVTPPKGESLRGGRKRVARFLKDCLRKHKNKTVAVVSHGGAIKLMLHEALDLPSQSLWALKIEPATVTILNFHKRFVQLGCLNVPAELGSLKRSKA